MKSKKLNIDKNLYQTVISGRTRNLYSFIKKDFHVPSLLRIIARISLFILLISISISLSSCSKQNDIYKRSTFSMGTTIDVQVKGVSREKADPAITKAFQEIERLNQKYSTYIDSNWMWVINHTPDSIKVDDETYYLLQQSERFYKLTKGAYDPAIGNYIELLGFEKGSPELPTQTELLNVLDKVGWKKVDISKKNLLRKRAKVKLSFNAIVAGFAVDKMAAILDSNGIHDYLINGGGEIISKGSEWKIGIQHPRKQNELMGVIVADGLGVATSGDYQQYFEKNGKRYSHIINPLTGLPVEDTEAVTIIAENAATADALSTGIFVMGPEDGMNLIDSLENVEGIIVDSSGEVLRSAGFDKFFRRN